jgi:hypothetical protein
LLNSLSEVLKRCSVDPKRPRMNSRRYQLNLLLALLSLSVLATSAQAFETPSFKTVDKVELLSIDYEKDYIKRVIETKSILGKEAATVFRVWKQQKLLGESPSACHQPAYAMKLFSKDKLVMFVTICWACRNIAYVVPRGKHWIRFQADSKSGQRMKRLFTEAFPRINNVISRATEQTPGWTAGE